MLFFVGKKAFGHAPGGGPLVTHIKVIIWRETSTAPGSATKFAADIPVANALLSQRTTSSRHGPKAGAMAPSSSNAPATAYNTAMSGTMAPFWGERLGLFVMERLGMLPVVKVGCRNCACLFSLVSKRCGGESSTGTGSPRRRPRQRQSPLTCRVARPHICP